MRLEQEVKVKVKVQRLGSTEVWINVEPKVEDIGYNSGENG